MGGRLAAVWKGRGGKGKKKKEKQRKRVSADGWVYNGFFRWNHWRIHFVRDSIGDSVTSLLLSQFESLGNSVGKIVWRHHAVAYFQTNCIPRRRNGWYIPTKYFRQYTPTISPTDIGRRYILTEFETELCSLVIINDEIFSSVIPLVFSGFLVVLGGSDHIY